MTKRCCTFFFAALAAVVYGDRASADERELVQNPTFVSASAEALPDQWTVWSPLWEQASCRVRFLSGGLVVDAPQRPYAIGGVSQDVQAIEPGKAYAIEAVAKAANLPTPSRSVLVRLTWTRAGKLLTPAGMLVRGPQAAEDTLRFADVLVAPKEADGARLSLELKWPLGGSVCWQRASVRATTPPPPRKVKVGTVYLRPKQSTPERNLQLFCQQIDAAGRLGLDMVCLSEAITVVGTSRKGPQVAEPIPGPSTQQLGRAAEKNNLWVVAGLYERDGDQLFNTAVLLDRRGRLAGKYRKTHLPREEWQVGFTPGQEYPVFQTEFGTIAIQICYDAFFSEPEQMFALQGAEIIFAPTWGTTFADEDGRAEGETMFRIRARDNGVYLVPSVYDGNSLIIDPMGRILASSKGQEGVFWHEIDLNVRECLKWVGHWRSIGPRDRMPSTYGPLLTDPARAVGRRQ